MVQMPTDSTESRREVAFGSAKARSARFMLGQSTTCQSRAHRESTQLEEARKAVTEKPDNVRPTERPACGNEAAPRDQFRRRGVRSLIDPAQLGAVYQRLPTSTATSPAGNPHAQKKAPASRLGRRAGVTGTQPLRRAISSACFARRPLSRADHCTLTYQLPRVDCVSGEGENAPGEKPDSPLISRTPIPTYHGSTSHPCRSA
jgi:hypothetical protein